MNKIVAFDLDGTLCPSDQFLLPAYRATIERMGLDPLPDEVLKQMIGGTAEGNWKIVTSGRPFEAFRTFSEYVNEMAALLLPEVGCAYPQIPESLAELRRRGYRTVLCSNGGAGYVAQVLSAIGVDSLFDEIPHTHAGWDKSRLLQQILEDTGAEKAVLVGDRRYDEEAARANGIPFIGCLYGLFPDEVRTADIAVSAAADLPAAVEALIG